MTIVLDKRADRSLAVYIDGDLQFDSRDEQLYHELLALPALAFASARHKQQLRVLVCGGGDGFVARELLKSSAIKSLDLVDYDPQIIELARTEWPHLHHNAFDDPRLHIHIDDAVHFVAEAARFHRTYDLVICDFTVPRDIEGARLHAVEWYTALHEIMSERGVLAINAASPSQTPLAYWSIYNSLRTAKLNPRPYRFVLPSFTNAGYGDDWGFFLAAPQTIRISEFRTLRFAEPRAFLEHSEQFQRCFAFPAPIAAKRTEAAPTAFGSEWLLQALFNPSWEDAVGVDWTSLDWNHDTAPLPPIDHTTTILPQAVQTAFNQAEPTIDEEQLFQQVVTVLPALRADQTRSMIREFVEQPARFLLHIDLPAIVDALLKRAAELPQRLVGELRLLRTQLRRSWSNPNSLLQKGLRVVSIIAIVIILSNIIHPDAAYGKGASTGSDGYSTGTSLSRTSSPYDVVQAPPSRVEGRGFSSNQYGRGTVVDEGGAYYPTRRYRYHGSYYRGNSYRSYNRAQRPEDPNEGDALYRLTPESDLLANGEIAIALTDQAYLLLADQVISMVDNTSGLPIMFLKRDPALIWRTSQELKRQQTGLRDSVTAKRDWMDWMSWIGFAPWRDDDEVELQNMQRTVDVLQKAQTSLGDVPVSQPQLPVGPFPQGYQLFSGVWINQEGTLIALERPDDVVYLSNCSSWWADAAQTQQLSEPVPPELCRLVLQPFLSKQINEASSIEKRLTTALSSARNDLLLLQNDKRIYEDIRRRYGASDVVDYGSSEITVSEALRLTDADLSRTTQLISVLEQQKQELPGRNLAIQRINERLK